MDVVHKLDVLAEYVDHVNLKKHTSLDKHARKIIEIFNGIQSHESFKTVDHTFDVSADIHMFCSKMRPQRSLFAKSWRVTKYKMHDESSRREELLILRHRIIKKINRLNDALVLHLWNTNPDGILHR